ncbi:MAG: hypothetical protein WCX69_00020 [Candidatus Paceibacterota bacterium]
MITENLWLLAGAIFAILIVAAAASEFAIPWAYTRFNKAGNQKNAKSLVHIIAIAIALAFVDIPLGIVFFVTIAGYVFLKITVFPLFEEYSFQNKALIKTGMVLGMAIMLVGIAYENAIFMSIAACCGAAVCTTVWLERETKLEPANRGAGGR